MAHKVSICFSNAADLSAAQSIFGNACPGKEQVLVCDGNAIILGIDGAENAQVDNIVAQVAGINAQINEHEPTFYVATQAPSLH